MLSPDIRELIRNIVELFAQIGEIPIAIYEMDDDGKIRATVRADERLFAPERVDPHECQAGLASNTEPIIVNGKAVAVVQYGTFHASNENKRKLEWLQRLLPPIICSYIAQKEELARTQQIAYHELRLRFTAILAYAENILFELPPETYVRESLEDLMGVVEATGMVMHSLTRGQYLASEYNFRRKNIRNFIDHLIRLFRPEARNKNVAIMVDLQPQDGLISLEVSEEHLQQAFNNLIHNALKLSFRVNP